MLALFVPGAARCGGFDNHDNDNDNNNNNNNNDNNDNNNDNYNDNNLYVYHDDYYDDSDYE